MMLAHSRRHVHAFALLSAVVFYSTAACSAQILPPSSRTASRADTLDPNLVPAGLGKLRQEDITLRFTLPGGLQIRAIPLDERIIRLLSPDSYRVMSQLKESKKRTVDSIADRTRLQSYSLWFVTFSGVEQGEARFSPQELIIQNVGRDFRPIDVLPLTSGFGEYRVKQRESQSALFVFDGQLDINQPLSAQMENTPASTDWQNVLQRVEQERAAVRSRAASLVKPPPRLPE
ncbi:MAG: hypothetical protein M3Y64_07400 [Gemmatimonadota bacterium]|nr:hypothetical protein [Gemmatimonadota bacterium]